MESKAAGVLKNVKKPIMLNGENLDVSLDKEVSESIDKPLFQADKRDNSGLSGQGIKIDGSEPNKQKEISGQRNMFGEGLNFDVNGYFNDQEYFTTEQNEYFQQNMFTQNVEALSEHKKKVEIMSFDEIKERLDKEFASKVAKPKGEKNQYIKMDEDPTKQLQTADTSINFDCNVKGLFKNDEMNACEEEDFVLLLPSLQEEGIEPHRGDFGLPDDNFPQLDIGGQDFDLGMNQEIFTDLEPNFQPQDRFIGDENVKLELPDQFTESQGSFAERIIEVVQKGAKRKDKKIFFSDVVDKFSAERDVADLFYDLMCACKIGNITLAQEFHGPVDRVTHLPVIEIGLR